MPTALSDRRTAKVRPADARYLRPRLKVSDLANTKPIFSAHRNSANVFPENDIRGIRACAAMGAQYINVDVQLTLDGQLVLFHDTTVDRTTTSTGLVSSYTLAQIKALISDTSSWFSPVWADVAPTTLLEVLTDPAIMQGHILLIETFDGTGAATAALVKQLGLTGQVAFCSRSFVELRYGVAAGIECWFIDDTATTPVSTLNTEGVAGICAKAGTATTTQVNAYRAAGIKVELHTVQRRSQIAAYDGCDVNLWATDELLYAAGDPSKYRLTRGIFDAGIGHGMVPSTSNSTTATNEVKATGETSSTPLARGYIPRYSWWGMLNSGACLIGQLAPLVNPTNGGLSVKIAYDAWGSDSTRYGGFLAGAPDDRSYFQSALNAGNNGNQTILRRNGSMELGILVGGSFGTVPTLATFAMQQITLAGALTAGVAITNLTVNTTTAPILIGQEWTLPDGQLARVTAFAGTGATSLTIASVTPRGNVSSGVVLPPVATMNMKWDSTGVTAWRSDVSLASVATGGIASGSTITSIPISALGANVTVGQKIMLANGQVATVAAAGTAGVDTSVAINSLTLTSALAAGAGLYFTLQSTSTANRGAYVHFLLGGIVGGGFGTSFGYVLAA